MRRRALAQPSIGASRRAAPRRLRWLPAFALTTIAVTAALGVAAPAAAHPLGNFSVNHFHGLSLYADRIEDLAVVDEAEIPTLQQRGTVDRDGDGQASAVEQAAYARATCQQLAADLHVDVAGHSGTWAVTGSSFAYRPGAANLPTGRTECRLTAVADLRESAVVRVADRFRADRVGWHEITAVGHGIDLADPPVPATSISDQLRRYPEDLLSSPLAQRSVELHTTGAGAGAGPARQSTIPLAGPVTRIMGALGNHLNALAGADQLTPLAGTLAVLLALLLGAGHAALPGHGKTVMAAYIAGRRGSYRDAIAVGATVTATHTAGVLVIGLLLTTATRLAGEDLLGWLGVVSGLLIAAVGAGLLRSALARTTASPVESRRALATVGALDPDSAGPNGGQTGHGHAHHHGSHGHEHGHQHGRGHHRHGSGRAGLWGLGIAGGIVPSPSALVVLLGAVALGRTWFGVLLVVAYGAGMAATLTLAGLLLVHLHRRFVGRLAYRMGGWSARLARATPHLTATLVLVVGLLLALRAAGPLLHVWT
ncbi:hypothetical protein [Micromonospora sp. NPDC005806]|uniref:hypothetical protein n=1 Tax=Micromonospora sp. NPDC005806 TaxID=3364234 RepID=UPI0036C7DF4A